MYTILLIILIALAGLLFIPGAKQRRFFRMAGAILLFLFTILFFGFMGFWGEYLWFSSIGYPTRFWVEILAKVGFFLGGLTAGLAVVWLMTWPIPRHRPLTRWFSRGLGALVTAVMAVANWDLILRFLNRVPSPYIDPILGRNASFYLFSLPFCDLVYNWLLTLVIFSLLALVSALFVQFKEEEIKFAYPEYYIPSTRRMYTWLFIDSAIFLFVLAWGKFLARFHLLYSTWGAVSGPGWTDVHIRLPAYFLAIIVTVCIGIVFIVPPLRNRIMRRFRDHRTSGIYTVLSGITTMLLFWFLVLTVIPGLLQWLRVEPNEITYERPYIANNIEYTRYGFKLDQVEEREYPTTERFTRDMVAQNQNLFSNIRLWDYRALDAVYKQFQEIRLYYEFADVDIDRYTYGDTYRQVMVSAREMNLDNLPEQSQTFVNRRFKYTHGYGVTLTPVNEFTSNGLPDLLVKDIPPKSRYQELTVQQPAIYYGELTTTPVYVNTKEEEFDYPSGEENVYVRYSGSGGVPISNLWRKFLFGWKFDGTKFLLSGYPTAHSRVMFHRNIIERVSTVAPFLEFDQDPYIVLADGRLYWIIDAYTTSSYFPYSEPFSSGEQIEYKDSDRTSIMTTQTAPHLNGINYIRNSVKAVVDAYHGDVDFYIYDPEDPIIQVWSKIFPGLFRNKDDLPPALREHIRYPRNILLVQGLVYAKYHMTDPTVFYNQEDLWVRATEKYYNRVQPVVPYYIMWEPPGKDHLEYVLILPFTPKNRQVLIGWIAGMCDRENYGRFLAYKFPKEKRVIGPQQVETKIDQDRFLSGQLTLWDQRGSNVIRGNVLAIPVEKTIIYVEPIYLQAETAAYPELRLVVMMHHDVISYAENFDQALEGLFGQGVREIPAEPEAVAEVETTAELIRKADRAFEDYLRLQGEKRFQEAAGALQELQEALNRLTRQQEDQGSE
jgi:hypothetical protein